MIRRPLPTSRRGWPEIPSPGLWRRRSGRVRRASGYAWLRPIDEHCVARSHEERVGVIRDRQITAVVVTAEDVVEELEVQRRSFTKTTERLLNRIRNLLAKKSANCARVGVTAEDVVEELEVQR